MRILLIRNFPSYLEVKNSTYNIQEVGLAKAFVKKGNICDIIFWTDAHENKLVIPVEDYGVINIYYKTGRTMFKNTFFIRCEELFEQYDVLQPCEYNQLQSWYLARKYPNKTFIYHGPYYSSFNKRYNLMSRVFDALFLQSYIKWDTKFIVKSSMAMEYLLGKGIKERNLCISGVGIDIEVLYTEHEQCNENLYIQMETDSDKLKLLYVGRIEERRNILFLVDVFKKIKDINNKARLYLVGTGEKKYLDEVIIHAKDIGVFEYITWQEKIEQKYLSRIYDLADFFLLTTEYEIFGMVLLEAMYFRNLVITTRNGGSSTLIESGVNGIIIDDFDEEVWSSIILELVSDNDRRIFMQNNASQTVRNNYTWDAIAEKFIIEYKQSNFY